MQEARARLCDQVVRYKWEVSAREQAEWRSEVITQTTGSFSGFAESRQWSRGGPSSRLPPPPLGGISGDIERGNYDTLLLVTEVILMRVSYTLALFLSLGLVYGSLSLEHSWRGRSQSVH
jgi:hypothetical protein